MALKVVKFVQDRETKGAIRYQEQSPDGQEIIGQLYCRKSGFAIMGEETMPKEIVVAVATGDDAADALKG